MGFIECSTFILLCQTGDEKNTISHWVGEGGREVDIEEGRKWIRLR